MAVRNPTAQGLTVQPNAPGGGSNPAATAQELQQAAFWGRYDAITDLPNVGTVDGSAVTGANPAANPAWSQMRPGDFAYVQDTQKIYYLQVRGTLSGSDAVWVSSEFTALPFAVTAVDYNLDGSIGRLYVDNSGGPLSINLPDPATVVGRQWYIEFISDSMEPVTFVRFAGENIQGYAGDTVRRAPWGSWILACDGTDWWLQGQNRLDLEYTTSDTETVQAGWHDADAYLRPGAGGGGGGGGGGNAPAGTTGGGGGKGGGGGGVAVGVQRPLQLPPPGTVLTMTVGAGGAGGAGGAANSTAQGSPGGAGGLTEISVGGVPLLRAAHALSLSVGGGGGGGTGGAGSASATAGTTGGQGATAANAYPGGFGTASVNGGNGGNGGAGAGGSNGTAPTAPTSSGSPWRADTMAAPLAGQGGAVSGAQGGGGGGGAGGGTTYADEFSFDGTPSATTAGRGGSRSATEGNGGAGNNAGVGNAGVAGAAGTDGTNGRGGGGGEGGGGGGSGSGGGGAGGAGGAGGDGSDGLIVFTVWE